MTARDLPVPSSPLPRALRILGLAFPFVILAAWTAAAAAHASIVIDGVRYFYLDDGLMVSMRYGRNLAEGSGLVWNAGERVEGYSNPGWTLVMAAVHLTGARPEVSSLIVKAIALICGVGVLAMSRELRRLIGRSSFAGEVALLIGLAMNADVVFWAANGFETTLLTATFLWLLVRVVRETGRGAPSAVTLIAAGTLPVIRSDAHLLAAAVAAIAVGLAPVRREALRLTPLVLLLPTAHLMARLEYYGDWLPNTFYLRQSGVPDVWREGARYVRAFVLEYWVLLGAAATGAVFSRDRRSLWLLTTIVAVTGHAMLAGGDAYAHFRFLAPAVPVVLVLAVAAVELNVSRDATRHAALIVLTVAMIVAGDLTHSSPVDRVRSWRGKPWDGVVIGRLIDRCSSPDASVAAADTGAIGYFSRRRVIDLVGRTDPGIARRPARPGADPGTRKFDIEHSLAKQPDFVITGGPHEASRFGQVMFALSGVDPSTEIGPAIVSSRRFLSEYRDTPVPLEPLLRRSAIYVRRGSPEQSDLSRWQFPDAPF